MFFKREKGQQPEAASPAEILEKHDRYDNPSTINYNSSYDDEVHTPNVLSKYLNQEAQFLEAILEANKGKLKESSGLLKEVRMSLSFAENDEERAKSNLKSAQSKMDKKNQNTKKDIDDVDLRAEFVSAERAEKECKARLNRMQSLNNLLEHLEEGGLDKDACQQLKANIKTLRNCIDNLLKLTDKTSEIHQKYKDLWGQGKEYIEGKLEEKNKKIDKKEIVKFEKLVTELNELLLNLPKHGEFLDEFLSSVESKEFGKTM